VFAGWLVYRDHTEVDQLVVWNAVPGQHIGVECHWGDHRCPGSGRKDSLLAVRVPPSGFVDLRPRFRRVRLEPFSRLSSDHLTIFPGDRNYNFDPDSDAYNLQRGRYPTW
jgi:hypothetical protein